MKDKIKVLMVCHGNICRSPMAEYILKDLVAQRNLSHQFHIASAATSKAMIDGINKSIAEAADKLGLAGIGANAVKKSPPK